MLKRAVRNVNDETTQLTWVEPGLSSQNKQIIFQLLQEDTTIIISNYSNFMSMIDLKYRVLDFSYSLYKIISKQPRPEKRPISNSKTFIIIWCVLIQMKGICHRWGLNPLQNHHHEVSIFIFSNFLGLFTIEPVKSTEARV